MHTVDFKQNFNIWGLVREIMVYVKPEMMLYLIYKTHKGTHSIHSLKTADPGENVVAELG